MADNIHIKLPDGSDKEVPKGSTALDVNGSPVLQDSAAAHFPASQFVFRP
jgi:hypothetical protein